MSQRQDYEELLRRALHSAADSVEPSKDGLERIRARLTAPSPLPVAWMRGAYPEVSRRALGGLESAAVWLQTALGRVRDWLTRPDTPEERRMAVARLRLAAALVTAALIIVGVSALTPWLRQTVSLTGGLIHPAGTHGPAGTGGPGVGGHGGAPLGGGAATGAATGTQNGGQPSPAGCGTR